MERSLQKSGLKRAGTVSSYDFQLRHPPHRSKINGGPDSFRAAADTAEPEISRYPSKAEKIATAADHISQRLPSLKIYFGYV